MILTELRVRDLGVIADLTLLLGPGMTALTGETGAGKTLVVEAIELLLGGRADPVLVRPGAVEAVVEGRFAGPRPVDGTGPVDATGCGEDVTEGELVLARSLPGAGRSRGYIDGRMAPLGALATEGGQVVDLHGQHAHQSLLSPSVQRAALDAFGRIDHDQVTTARRRLRQIDDALGRLGGDDRARAREMDLLRFQVAELDRAGLDDPGEDDHLAAEEDRLADAGAHKEAAMAAYDALQGDDGATEMVGRVVALAGGRRPLAELTRRLRDVAAELADIGTELREAAETLEDDPVRLEALRSRRHLLVELRRKYGDRLADVIAFTGQARARLEELSSYETRAAELDRQRADAADSLATAEAALGAARRAVAPLLAVAVEGQLHQLAMARARFEVHVGVERDGADLQWLLGANPGEPALPLSKVASGGELARTMLAVRLALSQAASPPATGPTGARRADGRVLIFDEVDAGIGGEAAVAVGRALADLARHQQVLVVTHLPQVAAFADHQVAVRKVEVEGRTEARAQLLTPEERVVELSRMLSGQPDSLTARRHAEELLADRRP